MKNVPASILYAIVRYEDGREERVPLIANDRDGVLYTELPGDADFKGACEVDYAPEMGEKHIGDKGYYIVPHGERTETGDSFLCRFRERGDAVIRSGGLAISMWGCVSPELSFMAAAPSMTYEYDLITEVKGGRYRNFPRFSLGGGAPYEPVRVEYHVLTGPETDYNDIALAYRRYREKKDGLRPIAEREKTRPALAYSADSVYTRVRMAWKPVPPPVREQTPETEPPMHVAATFGDVSALLDEFSRQGIDRAEVCLVGWNKSGHDGRWPQTFPVEEALGGEQALRSLTAKADKLGYAMVCHTNSTDAYSIADCWKDTQIMQDGEGRIIKNGQPWSGGDMYQVCPVCGLRQAKEILPKVRELGFRGTHYIDVIGTVAPRTCYAPHHPVTKAECVKYWNDILRFAGDTFGGISSEGGFDFCAPVLDYGLYISFGARECVFADEYIPLWELIYHGYILYNPYTKTVNPTAEDLLKLTEYGGRPSFYIDSKFVTPEEGKSVNWMGENDWHCHTEEERKAAAEWIAKVYRWYRDIRYLQRVPMAKHEILDDGKRRVRYVNGDEITVDYAAGAAWLNGKRILPIQ